MTIVVTTAAKKTNPPKTPNDMMAPENLTQVKFKSEILKRKEKW